MEALTYKYYATLVEVTDGDTVKLSIDLGFSVSAKVSIRIADINAEEIYGVNATEAGKEAKVFLQSLLPVGTKVIVHTEKWKQSFTRYVGHVYLSDGQNVGNILVSKGFAARVRREEMKF